MAVWRLLEFYCRVVLMLCLYMFRNVFIQIFFRRLFYYFAVDVYVPAAAWNLTLRLGFCPRLEFSLSECEPITTQFQGLMCL